MGGGRWKVKVWRGGLADPEAPSRSASLGVRMDVLRVRSGMHALTDGWDAILGRRRELLPGDESRHLASG